MNITDHPVALITGGSRGIGAATALAVAKRGYDVAITYRNKAGRAEEIAAEIRQHDVRSLAVMCDITKQEDIDQLFVALQPWASHLNLLVLNASGGLERELVADDPDYPMKINRDAQIAFVEKVLSLMTGESTIIFVTSHWAHLYGQVANLPVYTPIAESKYAGEHALRAMQEELAHHGIRLLVVTGDLIEGTITPKLLERAVPGLAAHRRDSAGQLPTTIDMAEAIANAAANPLLASGHTVVVGGSLESLL